MTPQPEPLVDAEDLMDDAPEARWESETPHTREQVLELLGGLSCPWDATVRYVDFADYVQSLPNQRKVTTAHETRPGVLVDEWRNSFTLYMTVAGRVKMLEAIALNRGLAVDVVPEPVTPTGIPGYLVMDERLVYRVIVRIDEDEDPLGSRPGTAWVPLQGGKDAAGTNPWEKVETSALGRALAAWGIGVLPGSGISSVEEIQGVPANRAAVQAGAIPTVESTAGKRMTRDEMIEESLALAETLRQRVGGTEAEAQERIGKYFSETLGAKGSYDAETNTVLWDKVKDGRIALLMQSLRGQVEQAEPSDDGE